MFQRFRGLCLGLAAAALSAAATAPEIVAAFAKTRSISLYNIHTKETVDVTYKKDGQFVPEAMEKINWILRDWRRNEPTRMDPDLIDLLWEIHTELGSRERIHIISGYRSRGTNEELRKTVGGQASQSQHIQGKAMDVHFPDVPLKQIRYSALIRERGGVGYYPTSAIPFVHIDTSRVRHWPRLPRYELALLFPNGQSKHQPADGGPISREDVRVAQAQHRDLAVQVAEFFNFRSQPKTGVAVADASGRVAPPVAVSPAAPAPRPLVVAAAAPPPPPPAAASATSPVVRTVSPPPAPRETKHEPRVAAQPPPAPSPRVEQRIAALPPVSAPALVSEPRLVERPSRFTPRPSQEDRARLDALVTLASYTPAAPAPVPRLVAEPRPAARPQALASLSGPSMPLPQFLKPENATMPAEPRLAALTPQAAERIAEPAPQRLSDAVPEGWGNGFIAAPEFDEEHPDELSYRPFPIAPLLTASASADDPALVRLTAPDVARTLDLLDGEGRILPMRFHPGAQTAALLWAQQFKGGATGVNVLDDAVARDGASGLSQRAVRTLSK